MITIYTGIPGSGKSIKTAEKAIEILERNLKWYEKTGIKRQIYSNIKFGKHVEKYFKGYIQYWEDPADLIKVRNADVFWDEIATHLDSTQWANVPLDLKRWLQQHRKFGIEIFGNTQDFSMVDISMRRMTENLYYLKKLIGSRDKSATSPEVKQVWGIIMVRELNPRVYKEDSKENQAVGLPRFIFITKKLIEFFDTTQEIKAGKYPPLKHIERECSDPNCTFHKVVHL